MSTPDRKTSSSRAIRSRAVLEQIESARSEAPPEASQVSDGGWRPPSDTATTDSTTTFPWTIEQREEMLNDHPVVRANYTVPTQMLRRVHEEARGRVWTRRTGVVFYAETRAGKTTCALSIMDYLREEFASVYVSLVSCKSSARPTPGHISGQILKASHHVLAKRPDPKKLVETLIEDVKTNVADLGGDQYVLILDEVNRASEYDLNELLEIHNDLHLVGVSMTTISFGQPEILTRITSLQATGSPQIIARFFRKPVAFQLCNREDVLFDVLRSLDEDTEWPEGSGWTYTYFFFPRSYNTGFRMANHAAQIWNALVNAAPTRNEGFTMETIALTVNGIYVGCRHLDMEGFVLSDKDIALAVNSSDV